MKATYLQTNFTAGEISPQVYGRVDIAKYQNGAKRLRDVIPRVYGGAKRRDGSLFVHSTKTSAKRSRLIPFVFNASVAYILEFGDLYMRVYKDGALLETSPGNPFELVTTITESQLFDLDYTQGADTMFLFHEALFPLRLVRAGDMSWSIGQAPLLAQPFDEVGMFLSTAVTLSAASVGDSRTATAAAGVFLPADVGRQILFGGGVANITGYTSELIVTVQIVSAFPSTSISGSWRLTGSPQAFLTPTAAGPLGNEISLTLSTSRNAEAPKTITGASGVYTAATNTTLMTISITGHGYANSDTIRIAGLNTAIPSPVFAAVPPNGTFPISGVATNSFQYTVNGDQTGVSVGTGTAARQVGVVNAGGWRADDVGKFVSINGGVVEIKQYVSNLVVKGNVKRVLTSTTGAQPGGWFLESAVWTPQLGYPRTGTLFEQRLVAAGSPSYPQTVWGSMTGAYLDFTQGTNDDDGYTFTISSDQINPIQFIAASRTLVAFTAGGEFTITGGIEKPLSPTNVQVRQRSNYGCKRVRPVRIRENEIYVQRAGRKVRSFGYAVARDEFVSPDLSALSEHLTESGIKDMAWRQETTSVIFMAREDGKLVTVTYDADENVAAWAFHEGFTGIVESLATIPSADGDQVWAVVRRTINGSEVRYVERFVEDLRADCAVVSNGAPSSTITDLGHLEGQDVAVVGDEGYVGIFTVTGGSVTLPKPRSNRTVGLSYKSLIELLDPEMQGAGSSFGAQMRANNIRVRVHETTGGKINGKNMIIRKSGTQTTVDAPPEKYSGFLDTSNLGWSGGSAEVLLEQDEPMPFYVLAVARELTVNQ